MEELILYIVRQLVDHPEEVQIRRVRGRRGPAYQVSVAPDDRGQVIGKEGRIIEAVRHIVEAAAARQGLRVTLDLR